MKLCSLKPVHVATFCFLFGVALASQAQTTSPRGQDNTPPQQRGGGRGARAAAEAAPNAAFTKLPSPPIGSRTTPSFGYTNALRGGASEFILVDAVKGVRQPAFDQAKLAASLAKAAARPVEAARLPFSTIEFLDDGKTLQFEVSGKTWKCDLNSYECTAAATTTNQASLLPPPANSPTEFADADAPSVPNEDGPAASLSADDENLSPQQGQQARGGGRRGGGGGRRGFGARPQTSPDNQWTAIITNSNIWLRPTNGGPDIQLTQDGVTNNYYAQLSWAPDSKTLVAWRVEPGDDGQVYLIESSPTNGGRAIMDQRGYPQAGDEFTKYELNLFALGAATNQQIKPDVERVVFDDGSQAPAPRWNKDGTHFTFEKEDRGHARFRVIDVEARTGAIRNVIDEKAKTFIWTMNTDAFRGQLRLTTYLQNSEEVIYESEQDGWRHLYLYDIKGAKLENQITKGEWLVRGIDSIDEDNRQIWFEACGNVPGQDPYYIHYLRVNFDGTGLTALDEGNGTHSVSYSPDRKYLIDTYSRLDLPPVNNLRRVSDGSLVCALEQADISELTDAGWKPSETFVAKGRDGQTDIYGVIDRPRNFDPSKKYPIIEDCGIYRPGLRKAPLPPPFPPLSPAATATPNYTSNGFIVVKIEESMG